MPKKQKLVSDLAEQLRSLSREEAVFDETLWSEPRKWSELANIDRALVPRTVGRIHAYLSLELKHAELIEAFVDTIQDDTATWIKQGSLTYSNAFQVDWHHSALVVSDGDLDWWPPVSVEGLEFTEDVRRMFATFSASSTDATGYALALSKFDPEIAKGRPRPDDLGYDEHVRKGARLHEELLQGLDRGRSHEAAEGCPLNDGFVFLREAIYGKLVRALAPEAGLLRAPAEAVLFCSEPIEMDFNWYLQDIGDLSEFWEGFGEPDLRTGQEIEDFICAFLKELTGLNPVTKPQFVSERVVDANRHIRHFCERLSKGPALSMFAKHVVGYDPRLASPGPGEPEAFLAALDRNERRFESLMKSRGFPDQAQRRAATSYSGNRF